MALVTGAETVAAVKSDREEGYTAPLDFGDIAAIAVVASLVLFRRGDSGDKRVLGIVGGLP